MDASPLKSSRYMVIVVIHIGTSESRIAYLFKHGCLENPLNVFIHLWIDCDGLRDTTPTCALFTKEKKFKAFGLDARRKYREHVDEETHTGVYYFERVIVDLFKKEVNGEFLSEDQTGKTMSSMDVLTACINYLCVFITDSLNAKLVSNLKEDDIRWVLPVPVFWNNKSMSFMRTAAINAGLPNEHIMIVKESEAAFLYCSLQNDEINKSIAGHPPWHEGHFLLLNVNHFAVDITVHLAQPNSHILELYKTMVENIGNTPLEQCLADIFCGDVIDSYIATYYSEYNYIKQGLGDNLKGIMPPTVCCLIPASLLSHFESTRDIKLADHITDCFGGIIRANKLKLDSNIFKQKLRKFYGHIVCSMRRTFEIIRMIDVSAIIIVGKLSEYPMLHDVIREAFHDKQIIVSKNAESAVSGGAVIYGHQLLSGKRSSQSTEKKLFSQH